MSKTHSDFITNVFKNNIGNQLLAIILYEVQSAKLFGTQVRKLKLI